LSVYEILAICVALAMLALKIVDTIDKKLKLRSKQFK